MKKTDQYFLLSCFILASLLIPIGTLLSQVNTSVQVKVYDKQLNPQPDLTIEIEGKTTFTSNARGIAFIELPENQLPPTDLKVISESLEAESWNYSKGILEIIVRKKSYRPVNIQLLDAANDSKLPGIATILTTADSILKITSNNQGILAFTLPLNQALDNQNAFSIEGYEISKAALNNTGGTLYLQKNIPVEESTETSTSKKEQNIPVPVETTIIGIDNLDSINSITVLYSLMKDLDYNTLDEETKSKLDAKFNELLTRDLQNKVPAKNPLALISDTSLILEDILLIGEKLKLEEQLLLNAKDEFEVASDQVKEKLKDGGQKLNEEQRQELINDVLNLREMLRKNEELFYKNNAYYRVQVDSLINQLADIYELEDLLIESEETSIKMKENFIIFFFAFIGLAIMMVLMIYLIKIFSSQKNELTKANDKIRLMNANLEIIVDKKTEDLKLINHELDTFLYRSSHNLKGPLTTIKGLANIAHITLGAEAKMLFDKVVLTTKGMEKMLDKLNMMNQLNQPSEYGQISISDLVNNLIAEYSNTIERRNIDFAVDMDESLNFDSFPHVIEIILNNCLENAFYFGQFTNNGPSKVSLIIKKDDKENLEISIRDNGCGIKDDVIEKIWNMFFIGIEISKGSGLGLYITKKAVEELDGEISIATEVNTYCEVKIKLPVFSSKKDNSTFNSIQSSN